jgi:methylmalonyl-CoA/ethylmalonyl-CoA epimerase
MGNVTELRVALTVENFDQAVAFYRDALGLEQIADWSSATGRVVVLEAGRATLELFDTRQAESVDAIEAGRRVSGTVRFAVQVEDSVELADGWSRPGPNGSRSLSPRRGAIGTPGSRPRTGCS